MKSNFMKSNFNGNRLFGRCHFLLDPMDDGCVRIFMISINLHLVSVKTGTIDKKNL